LRAHADKTTKNDAVLLGDLTADVLT